MTRRLILDQGLFDAMAARLNPAPPIGYSIEEDTTADGIVIRARWCCLRCASGQGEAPTRPAARRAADIHQMAAHGCETAVTA